MSVRLPIRMSSKLIALVAALGLAASAAEASEPVVIESSAWTTTGTMKAKIDSFEEELVVVATLEFGPNGFDLLEDQFRLTVDDGVEPVVIVSTYYESKPGKPTFDDLADEVAAALELDLVPELQEFDLTSKLKAKPKLKDGVETIKIRFKIKLKLSLDGESMNMAFGYKGEGTRVP